MSPLELKPPWCLPIILRIDVGLYDSTASNKKLQLRVDPDIFTTKDVPMHVDGDGFVVDLPEQHERNPIRRFILYEPVTTSNCRVEVHDKRIRKC
ncbi:hypothetical protein DPMN_075482 [Dreissena polymorpha]|uniref:Uncharacterized protein n=1 Tax=Dreissena polymorpha TaxID=45954 RepID=A0A9D4BMJ7_DREPO|nr:hypothetical protein DPMN_075482 [Dreissena polymorpha]